MDERHIDDVIYTDKGFSILVSRNIGNIALTAVIQYKKTVTGYRVFIR